jgi:quercetin dioxygenase-like cupin family protein
VKLKVGGLSGKDARPSPNDEFAFVYQGEVVLTLEGTEELLMSGDSVVIPAGANRRWRNDTPQAVQILIVSAKALPKRPVSELVSRSDECQRRAAPQAVGT